MTVAAAVPTRRGRRTLGLAVAALVGGSGGCAPQGPPPIRAWTQNYEFRITADPTPPRAREATIYRVVVLDKNTHEVIDRGEGQIFATSADRVSIYDSFTPAQEAGTYTARLNFITAGEWRMNVRFRRDSTAALEKPVDDWVQAVRGARPISERPAQ